MPAETLMLADAFETLFYFAVALMAPLLLLVVGYCARDVIKWWKG